MQAGRTPSPRPRNTGDLPPKARLPILLAGMLSLLAAVLAGLARLGWDVPARAAELAGLHAALLIAAFFGLVISLERAVALAKRPAYLAPAAAGLGGLALLAGAPLPLAQVLLVAGSSGLVLASGVVLRRLFAPFTVVLATGAACWLLGNLRWFATGSTSDASPLWLAFLILTIAGERLELSRFLPTPRWAKGLFLGLAGAVLLAALSDALAVFAGALAALALWLLRFDLASRNVRRDGLPRFIAVCLLAGYGWLLFAGLLGMAGALTPGHPWRDAALHALGLGFVFSMVLGHAPIIFPAVMRVSIPYGARFYAPLAALHASLAVRVAGNLLPAPSLHAAGGLLNAIALILFIATLLYSVWRGRRETVIRPASASERLPT